MVYITSDSTADLGELFATRNVTTLPLAVILNGNYHEDGVDVTPSLIYETVEKTGNLPKTSARSVEEYKEFFLSVKKTEEDAIVHFSISSGISVTCRNAILAAEEVKNVYIVDGQSLSSGTGLLVLYGCDLRDEGKSAAEIKELCDKRVPFIEASFFVDKMDYLYKGGRCSGLASFFATALKIKPSLLLKEGKIVVGKKYRGTSEKIATQYVDNIFEMYPNPDFKRIFITYTEGTPREVIDKIKNRVNEVHKFENVYETTASSTITCHCGPGTIGILFINDGGER
ncbi:MAG: DegV family protein [Clostridia bacterium]|nr:DegV family protein [Clostridia bacterium]